MVATELNREQMQRLARLGAIRRLEELRQEEAAIRSAFPDLFGRRRGRPPASAAAADGGGVKRRRRRRKPMTPAQRKAVSERMRKYWAGRRAKG
jgi:hypothetical protein